MIYKTLWGNHVDLSKIVMITDPIDYEYDKAKFMIYFQLMDHPVNVHIYLDIPEGETQEEKQEVFNKRCEFKEKYTKIWHDDIIKAWMNTMLLTT